MKLKYLFGILICFLIAEKADAQTTDTFKWWNPAGNAFPVLEGQAWPKEVKGFYDRLPARAEQTVRKAVWDLSRHSAGL